MNSAETASAAAAGVHALVQAGILLDAALIIAIFLVRVILLRVTARATSRGIAALEWKPSIVATAILCATYYVANPTMQTDNVLRPYLVMALVGILVCKRAFWIGIDHAVFCSLIFCLLCIFVGDYPRRVIDERYPERATVNRTVASLIDAHAARGKNGPSHEPSEDILTAIVRASSSTTSGVLGEVLGFLRTGIELKEQMTMLRKRAAEEAMLANLLSGGGTHVGNRVSEKDAIKELMGGDAVGPNVPFAPYPGGAGKGRHGYAATYAEAKAQIEEVNRVASNNAEIVNMLSGIGPQVGDRKEEMDKLYAALLEEAKQGGIDLSASGEPISDDQVASLSKGLGGDSGSGGTTNASPAEGMSFAAVRKALDGMRKAAGVYAASVNLMSGGATNAHDHGVKLDELHTALLKEAMRGTVDLSTNGGAVSEDLLARLRESMGHATAAATDTNAPGGAATNAIQADQQSPTNAAPALQLSMAAVQAALDDIRKAADANAASVKIQSAARARTREVAAEMGRREEILLEYGPFVSRIYRPGPPSRLVRASTFTRLRRYYRVPWEGALEAISASIAAAEVNPAPPSIAPKSEIVIIRNVSSSTNSGPKTAPAPPSPYELLSKEERAKWDVALQTIKVTGFVGSAADLAAIANGKLIRRGEVLSIDSAGSLYSFRLTGVSKKGNCTWEPMVQPAVQTQKKAATVTVRF